MYGETNRINLPNLQQVDNLSLDSLREVYKQLFNPNDMEIQISGDFEDDQIEQLLLKYIGTLG